MKRYFFTILSKILGEFGISIQRAVDPSQLLALVRLFQPQWGPNKLTRIGGDGDGGYLVPLDISTYDTLISPGVGYSTQFDDYFLDQNKNVVSIDPGSYEFINPNVQFHKKWLRGYSAKINQAISLTEILNSIDDACSLCLQIDIEGGEYEVIGSLSPMQLERFGVIVIELHLLGELLTKDGFQILSQPLAKLLSTHFVAHLHVNNAGHIHSFKGIDVPETMEVTLLSRSRYIPEPCDFRSPHPLDMRCISSLREKLVPDIWFR